MKPEFDTEEQKWRVIIPPQYTRSGKHEVKFFRNKKWADDIEPRILENAMARKSRTRQISMEERLINIEGLIEAAERADRGETDSISKSELVLTQDEVSLLKRILKAISSGQKIVVAQNGELE
jgi:hypothetical protein